MPKIAIVTDSTASCTQDKIGNVPVVTVPLDIVWDGKIYKDSVNIFPEDIYKRIKTSKLSLPSTNPPSPQDFYDVYKNLLDEGYEIISLHISLGISHTLNSAIQAKKLLGNDVPIEIHDSYVTAMVLKMLLIEAAEAIEAGKSLPEVAEVVRSSRERTQVFFTVKDLDHLVRGGRVTRFQSFLGKLFQVRPIFTFKNGEIVTMKNVLTFPGALRNIERSCINATRGKQVRNIVATYTDNEKFVTHFYDHLLKRAGIEKPQKAFIDPLTPVIGVHTGPGCVGLAFMLEE